MSSDTVSEALLEMHFTRALADLFASVFGRKVLRFWKPTQNAEVHLGFDQGWVDHAGSPKDFEAELRDAIANQTKVKRAFLGYFLQFKRVQKLTRSTKHTPKGISGEHFRVDLDLDVNERTGLSQHQTLIQLSTIPGADVSYACGMVFESSAIYDSVNLELLRIVPVDDPVRSASKKWKDGERHFIQFQTTTSSPLWCSEPFEGRQLSPEAWARSLRILSPSALLQIFEAANSATRAGTDGGAVSPFTIVEFADR